MFATQVLLRPSATEEIRSVLGACQYAPSARDYALQLVRALAAATDSPCAIWLNWPPHPTDVVAQTGDASAGALSALCDCAPLAANDLADGSGLHSIAAAPMMFRSSVAGVLAVANRAHAYTTADLALLAQIGRTAVLEFETRVHAEELKLQTMARRVADLAHELRQPLSILEACACLLELVLEPVDPRAREHLDEMHHQLDLAGCSIEQTLRGYAPRLESSRACAKSAISMVT
jgi:signal transduction histidine kinase